MKLKKNKILHNIKIEKIGFGGVGISTFSDGRKIIIKGGVLPNSIVDCRILKAKKDYIECQLIKYKKIGDIEKLIKVGDENLCSHNMILEYFGKSGCDVGCGGCKWQILPYEKQLELKFDVFKDSFRHIWDLVKDKVENILPSPLIFGYRNKVEFSFGYCETLKMSEDGKQMISDDEEVLSTIGFHRQGRWDQVVDVNQCLLISEKANQIYQYLKNFLKKFGLPNYNQRNHQGVYRHLVLRQGFNTGQFLINLVIATENDLAKKYKDKILELKEVIKKDKFIQENITTFVLTYNNGLADVVKGQDIQTEVLHGDGYIFEKLKIKGKELIFRISPFSFFQTNTLGAQGLFAQAVDYIQAYKSKNGYDYIFDLYCGTGTIGLTLLKLGIGKHLIGVEIVPEAIKDAWINAELNKLKDQSYFVVGKAEKIIFSDKNIRSKLDKIGLIVVDPPRDGLHKKVVQFLIDLKSKYKFDLLYISCNPVTLARDLKLFLDSGLFTLKVLRPVDMFPHTHHIENIAFLN